MELRCPVQNYEWGKIGTQSMVAQLISSANYEDPVAETKPYAEFWMGTHPNGPAIIIERDVLLSEYINNNLDAIGPDVRKKFGVAIPFLLKVLSVRKALSIQAHPNKEHAEILHNTYPGMYKDPNHKPELAIALTPFEALCGFRPISEIKMFLTKLPEFSAILSSNAVQNMLSTEEQHDDTKDILKEIFSSLMACNKNTIANSLLEVQARLQTEDEATQATLLYPLLRKLHNDYPGDVGCWAPYLMNYIQLKPGEAIYLGPNLPHAYLSGDCVECMACSDNVVRAGLTPKHIDVATLVSMLDYNSYSRDMLMFNPQLEDENSCIWRPPVQDFAVIKIKVNPGEVYNTRLRNSPSILVVVSGTGEGCDTEPVALRPGVVIFLKASRQLTLTASPEQHLEVFQAICNV